MTATSQSTRRKLSLLQLAEELGNVSKACKLMGYHRDTFYEVKRAFQIGGVATLVEQKRGPRNPHPNRVAADVEKRILDFSLEQPTRGPQYLANQLRLDNVNVSAGGVRGVWLRHDIETRHKRLMRLERYAREKTRQWIRLLRSRKAIVHVGRRCLGIVALRPHASPNFAILQEAEVDDDIRRHRRFFFDRSGELGRTWHLQIDREVLRAVKRIE
jgi:hypothetical protein